MTMTHLMCLLVSLYNANGTPDGSAGESRMAMAHLSVEGAERGQAGEEDETEAEADQHPLKP